MLIGRESIPALFGDSLSIGSYLKFLCISFFCDLIFLLDRSIANGNHEILIIKQYPDNIAVFALFIALSFTRIKMGMAKSIKQHSNYIDFHLLRSQLFQIIKSYTFFYLIFNSLKLHSVFKNYSSTLLTNISTNK